MIIRSPPRLPVVLRGRRGAYVALAALLALLVLGWRRPKTWTLRDLVAIQDTVVFEIITGYAAHRSSNGDEGHDDESGGGGADGLEHGVNTSMPTPAQPLRPGETPASLSLPLPPLASFLPGVPKRAGETYTKAVVIARTKNEEVEWLKEKRPRQPGEPDTKQQAQIGDGWKLYLYSTDDSEAEYHTPTNKGREATAYFTYLIDHYDSLPDITVFLHAHRNAWHDNLFNLDNPGILSSLDLSYATRHGYLNLRCAWGPGCPDWIHPNITEVDPTKVEQHIIGEAWRQLFPGQDVPDTLGNACCAQFALTRARAREIPRERYVQLRDWLLGSDMDDLLTGRVFEYVYQYLWTGKPVNCPAEHVCYCGAYGVCFGGVDRYTRWMEKLWEWNRYRGRSELLKEMLEEKRKKDEKEGKVGKEKGGKETEKADKKDAVIEGLGKSEEVNAGKAREKEKAGGGSDGGDTDAAEKPLTQPGKDAQGGDPNNNNNNNTQGSEDGKDGEGTKEEGEQKQEESEEDKERKKIDLDSVPLEMAVLTTKMDKLAAWLNKQQDKVKRRGRDPRVRAAEAGYRLYDFEI